MMNKFTPISLGMVLFVAGCTNHGVQTMSSPLDKAKNPDLSLEERKAAAALLTEHERQSLQKSLLDRIPKTWATIGAADDARVLGEIGDRQAISQLEPMLSYEDTGRMTTVIRWAIQTIEKRTAPPK